MELHEIAHAVFGNDCIEDDTSRILCKTSKKIFLLEVRDWLDYFLTRLRESNPTEEQEDLIPQELLEDPRSGRLGNVDVCFTLDRSHGILAINQEGLNVVSACRFASIGGSCGVYSGKWQYELHLNSRGIMQLGWCSNLCEFTVDKGCGDTLNSYSYDGSRIKSWNMLSKEYGETWKTGDVIGLLIDLDEGNVEFYRNGHSLGIAYSDLTIGAGIIYIPSVSLVEGETVCANFGARPFKYPVPEYQPLQKPPNTKLLQAEYLLKYLKNLTILVTPTEPKLLNCMLTGDISDFHFWNRMFAALCFHINKLLNNRYCLLNNFIPFVADIVSDSDYRKYQRIMDEFGMYIREEYIERSLYYVIKSFSYSFKQVSNSISSMEKDNLLQLLYAILTHEGTRRYLILHFIFDRFDIFTFLHHKPLDDLFMERFVGLSWWENNKTFPEIEANKPKFQSTFKQIEQLYNNLETQQCAFFKVLLQNDDGTDEQPSTRRLFLKKLKRFCNQELEYARNDLSSKLATSVAYGSFTRMVRVLEELWKSEIGSEPIVFPANLFYNKVFKYDNVDRVGGLEQFLSQLLFEELQADLGPAATSVTAQTQTRFDPELNASSIQFDSIRVLGLESVLNMLENNDVIMEAMNSNGPALVRAIFGPLRRDNKDQIICGNMDSRLSLLEFMEDIIMFFISTVSKHCHKISRAYVSYQNFIKEYTANYFIYQEVKRTKPEDDPLVQIMKTTLDHQKTDLDKRAKKNAWIDHVLLTNSRLYSFLHIFEVVVDTIWEAEAKGLLFSFVPDFYLEAVDVFTEVLVKDFIHVKSLNDNKEIVRLLRKIADLMIKLVDDQRIKHIDFKKYPMHIIATLASTPQTMKHLELVEEVRRKELVRKLIIPYSERHWKASNWVLLRFWHGDGFGFRYTYLPHHQITDQLFNAPNFAMLNIACGPSPSYQQLVRVQLLDTTGLVPTVLDSIISKLHSSFGEFFTVLQEVQRAIERSEQLMMLGRMYKMCAGHFDKTIALLRVMEMFIAVAPEVFLDSYYPESTSFTKRIIQVVLLIINRISSKNGCFRVVVNAKISILENVDYFPIETACIAILLNILRPELDSFTEDDVRIPLFSRMVLADASYHLESLKILIGSPTEGHSSFIVCLHDYQPEMSEEELERARKLLQMLAMYQPMMSDARMIPDDELCTICYSAPFDVQFSPCGHHSCLSCISYYLTRNRLCFFCKRQIIQVIRIEDSQVIESLTLKENLL